jgi:hypothetical protein
MRPGRNRNTKRNAHPRWWGLYFWMILLFHKYFNSCETVTLLTFNADVLWMPYKAEQNDVPILEIDGAAATIECPPGTG